MVMVIVIMKNKDAPLLNQALKEGGREGVREGTRADGRRAGGPSSIRFDISDPLNINIIEEKKSGGRQQKMNPTRTKWLFHVFIKTQCLLNLRNLK